MHDLYEPWSWQVKICINCVTDNITHSNPPFYSKFSYTTCCFFAPLIYENCEFNCLDPSTMFNLTQVPPHCNRNVGRKLGTEKLACKPQQL